MKKLAAIAVGIGAVTLGLYGGVTLYANKTAEAKLNQFIAEVDDDLVVQYGGVSTRLLGAQVTIRDVSIVPVDNPDQAMTVDRIIVRKFEHEADVPIAVDASLRGIQFVGAAAVPVVLPAIQQAGYATLPALNLDTKYDYSQTSLEASLEQFRIGADDLGYLEVSAKVGNVDPSAASSDPILHGAQVVYRDRAFAENWLAAMAADNNQEVGEFKAELSSNLSSAAQFFLSPDDPTATQALQATLAFIENPKGFSISVAPQTPLRVSDLMAAGGPQAWLTLLNLEIEAD